MDCETAILNRIGNSKVDGRGLMKTFASWCWLRIAMSLMNPSVTLSETKWQSISMCLVPSWKVGLEAIWMTTWLSRHKRVETEIVMPKSSNNCWTQTISLAVTTKAQYSVSVDEWDIVDCFLAFHDTKDSPRKNGKSCNWVPWIRQVAQSASEEAFSWREREEEKKSHWPGLNLRYRRRW